MVMSASVMQECARPTELSDVVERMQLEHEELSVLLAILKHEAVEASELDEESHSFHAVALLKQSTVRFMNRFEDHLQWGKNELFPLVGVYAGKGFEPSIKPSIWGLDKNYDLAVRYINAFLNPLGSGSMGEETEIMQDALSNLLQATVILTDYLEMEKTMVFPLADQLLTDLDYLFS